MKMSLKYFDSVTEASGLVSRPVNDKKPTLSLFCPKVSPVLQEVNHFLLPADWR